MCTHNRYRNSYFTKNALVRPSRLEQVNRKLGVPAGAVITITLHNDKTMRF